MAADKDRDRSAVDGRFVSDDYADRHPDITVSEPVEPRPAAGADRVHVRFASGIEQTIDGTATIDPATGALTITPHAGT